MKSNSRLPTPPAPWLGRKGSLLLWREMRRNRSRFMRLVPDAQILWSYSLSLQEDCPPRALSHSSLKRHDTVGSVVLHALWWYREKPPDYRRCHAELFCLASDSQIHTLVGISKRIDYTKVWINFAK